MMSDSGGNGGPGNPASRLAMADNCSAHYPCISPAQQFLTASNHFDPAVGRATANVSPLDRPPFLGCSENSHFVVSPDLNHSGSSLVMDASQNDAERNGVHGMGEVAGLRGLTGAGYNIGQHHDPLYRSVYHISKGAGTYLSLTAHGAAERNTYVGSAHDIGHFDRSQCNASPLNSYNRAFNSHSHFDCSVENVRGAPERNPFFPSQHGSSHHVPSTHLYAGITDGYSYRGDHMTTADRSLVDHAAGRIQSHFSSSVPSYVPLGAGSDYVYCNSSSVTTLGSINPPFPTNVLSCFSSSLDRPASYGQFAAPPPAHIRFLDASAHRVSFDEGERGHSPEGVPSKPFDATVSRSQLVVGPGWNHASAANAYTVTDTVPFEDQSRILTGEKGTDNKLTVNATTPIRNGEETLPLQDYSSSQVPSQNFCERAFPVKETSLTCTQKGSVLSSVSSENLSPPYFSSSTIMETAVDANGVKRTAQQQRAYSELPKLSTGIVVPNYAACPTLKSGMTLTSPTESSHTPTKNKSSSLPFVVTPGIYSDSGDSGEDTELEEKPAIQKCFVPREDAGDISKEIPESTPKKKQCQKQDVENDPSSVETKAEIVNVLESTETLKIPNTAKDPTASSVLTKDLIKEEPQLYDSSTSEYEPPSPLQAPVRDRKQVPEGRMTLRKRSFTTSFAEDSDDSADGSKPPGIKLIIRKERGMERSKKSRKLKQPDSRQAKKADSGVKRGKCQGRANKTCPLCQKTFTRADSLTCHMRVHTGDRPFHCEQCDASYKVSSHLRDHVRSKHSNSRPYECKKCGKTFTYSTARRRHEKICGMALSERVEFQCTNCEKGFVTAKGFKKHQKSCGIVKSGECTTKDEDLPFKCSTCEKAFGNYPGLDRHQRFFCGKTPQKGRYICEECGKMFQKRNRYITHTRRHTGEKPFKCPQCEACFYDKNTLRRHIDRHEGNRKFKCSLCVAAFYMKRCLSLHVMRIHCGMKPYKCNECDSDFSSGYKLSRHIRRVHRQERRFKCMLCKKGFFESSNWMKHMHQHALQPDKPVRGRTVKQHTCKFCNKSFFMKDLRAHIASEHPGATLSEAVTKELAKCDLCSKDFSCQESLRVHRLRHSGLKPFQCDKCDMSFLLKSALILHQRKHTDYRPHCCPECGKTFRWRASVSQHMITYHTPKSESPEEDVKRFTCHECGKRFKRQICLKVHLKRHREVMPCICSDCGKGFVDLCRLKIHMSMHDGPKPFMCETCGAGFFYQYLLDDHIKRRHTLLPRQAWLCEECGKSLCRKDSLQKHMALHAKYQDGKIPKAGRRKGTKYPSKYPRPPKLDPILRDGMKKKRGRPRGWRKNTGVMGLKSRLSAAPLADSKPADFVDSAVGNEMRPNSGAFEEPSFPYQLTTYIHHHIPWPQPGEQ